MNRALLIVYEPALFLLVALGWAGWEFWSMRSKKGGKGSPPPEAASPRDPPAER